MNKLQHAKTNMTGRPTYLRSRENNLPIAGIRLIDKKIRLRVQAAARKAREALWS